MKRCVHDALRSLYEADADSRYLFLLQPTLTPVHSVLSAQDQQEFKSFSWTAPHVA